MHYPQNLALVPKLFQDAQYILYIVLNSYFIATSISVVQSINNSEELNVGKNFREALGRYFHIVVAAIILFGVFLGSRHLLGLVAERAGQIRSTSGNFFMLKTIIVTGMPYFMVLMGVVITTLFAYLTPIIIVEKKNVFIAFFRNFKVLWGSFFSILFIVLIPTLLYIPLLLLRSNLAAIAKITFPEIGILVVVLSIFLTMFIDATIYTAIALQFLYRKEELS
jgi:hypothetical protein